MSLEDTDPRDVPGKIRGDDVRLKLVEAAIDVFGRHGFEGASTRTLSRMAGVNQQAIPYYFGGKKGLYLAVADHIADRLKALIGPVGARIAARFAASRTAKDGAPLDPTEARALLFELLETMAGVLVNEESASWARFIVTEQMEPTEAFERIYEKIMARLIEAARGLIAAIVHEDPSSETVRLRAVALIGQILVFRVAHAAVMRQLGWQKIGARERGAIRDVIRRAIDAITPASDTETAP
jgi:TetR/AcrR family transcriptional regulator, regulator of cefoperazone and chloramphenicol sensitivity